jgi:hypothetical protein
MGHLIFFFLCQACNRSRMTDLSCSTTFIVCYFDYVSVWGERVSTLECPYHGLENRGYDGAWGGKYCMLFYTLDHIPSFTHGPHPSSTHNYNRTPLQWLYCIPLLTCTLSKAKPILNTWHYVLSHWTNMYFLLGDFWQLEQGCSLNRQYWLVQEDSWQVWPPQQFIQA